ncbi:Centromere protein CENP-B, dimerization domain [Phytophthora cactorum]|nr:Centromere protein CENP-B, dimerization domain [Phytophthora cactorum]
MYNDDQVLGGDEDEQLDIEDNDSVYDDGEVDEDGDAEEPDKDFELPKKDKDDDDDEEEEDEEEEDEEDGDDDTSGPTVCKKRAYAYHQISESSEIEIIPVDKRVTSKYMTLYEYAMVVGTRATHIANGSIVYTDLQGLDNPRDIAIKEIDENKCPLSVTRKISPNQVEIWEVNEMVKPLL